MGLNKALPQDLYTDYQTPSPFPSDDVDPKIKEKREYCMAIARAIWSTYCLNNAGLPYTFGTNIYDYTTLRLYAEGNQPVEKYKNILARKNPDKDDKARGAYNSISWDNHSILPRFERVIIEKLHDFDINYAAFGVDDATLTEKTRMKNWVWERAQNQRFYKFLEENGIPLEEVPFTPTDQNELDMWAQMDLELAHEMKITKAVRYCLGESEWDEELSTQIRRDLFRLGISATYEYVDNYTRQPVVEYCDPAFTIFPKSNKYGYQDIPWAADVTFMSITDVRKQYQATGQYLDEKQFFEKIKRYVNYTPAQYMSAFGFNQFAPAGTWNFTSTDSHGAFPYDYLKVPVLRFEKKTWDTDVYSEIKTKTGETVRRPEKFNYRKNDEKRKTIRKGYECWYAGWWVIGSDLMIRWGKKEWIKRDQKGKTYSGYTIVRTDNRSFVAAMIPDIDEMELITKRFMMAWKNAAPSGYAIFMSALKNVTYKNQKLHPFDLIQIQRDTGTLLIDDGVLKNVQGKGTPAMMPIQGGVGNILAEFIQSYQFYRQRLADITGISDAMLGANPIPGQLVQTTEIALAGSEKVIAPLGRAYNLVKKRNFQKIMMDIQTIAKYDPEGFNVAFMDLSRNTLEKITIVSADADRYYALKAEPEATEFLKQEMISTAREAATKGQITYPDYQNIVRFVMEGQVRFATALMEYKLRKRQEQEQQINMQNVQANAQVQQQSLAQKGEIDAMLLQLEGRMRAMEQQVKGGFMLQNTGMELRAEEQMQQREFAHEKSMPQPTVKK